MGDQPDDAGFLTVDEVREMERTVRVEGRIDIDERTANVDNVNFPDRIITVLACPYEQPTEVMYRHEPYMEVVERSAFAGIERKNKIRVNREHDRVLTVGKVTGYFPDKAEGLVIDTYIARTALGDETLQLAADGILDGSVGMKVHAADQVVDRRARTRRIRRAFLDHFAFTVDPAYEGAQVLSVRATHPEERMVAPAPRPGMEEFWSDPMFLWAAERLETRADTKTEPYGDVKYADPGYKGNVKRYPVDSADHCRAAWSYINMPKNQAGYTAEQVAQIKSRIKAAAKRFGVQIADD